jgi:hypothetical protein
MTRIERERESFARIPAASTRRLFLKAGSAAAVFGSLSAATCSPSPVLASDGRDPVLIALEEFKAARAASDAIADPYDDDALEAAADRCAEARSAVLNAIPTTRTGAEWLALFSANETSKIDSDLARAIDTFVAFMFANGVRA